MGDLLIAEMGDKGGRRDTDCFIITLERLSKLDDQPAEQKLSNLWQFRVHDCSHRSVDRREGQTGCLCLHNAPAEETTATDQVLSKQFRHDMLDVRDIDLVDKTIDRLLQGLPRHSLILLARFIGDLRLERAQPSWRDIGSSGAHVQQFLIFRLCHSLFLLLCHRFARRLALFVLTKSFSQLPLSLDRALLIDRGKICIVPRGPSWRGPTTIWRRRP